MAKRKAVKKRRAKTVEEIATKPMPASLFAIKVLSGILAAILVMALTLFVLGRMPARGFFSLAIILAIIAFVIIPFMRRKFGGEE